MISRGLYDPILDDSEYVYVPEGPDDLDQAEHLQQLRDGQNIKESKESNISISTTTTEYIIPEPTKSYSVSSLKDIVVSNLKDVFPEVNIEQLPPHIKYKLPVSEQYDPDGKRIMPKTKNVVDIRKMTNLLKEQEHIIHNVEGVSIFPSEKTVSTEKKTHDEHLKIIKKQIERFKVDESKPFMDHVESKPFMDHSEGTAITNYGRKDIDIKLNAFSTFQDNATATTLMKQATEKEIKSLELPNIEKLRSEFDCSKVSYKGSNSIDTVINHELQKEVNVANEIKKFETFDILMDSTLNADQRKLLTQQDIEEAIEAGTVRQKTEKFKKGIEKIPLDKLKSRRTNISDVKVSHFEVRKERCYNIGMRVIPNIRAAVQFSYHSHLLFKRFLMQLTNVIITLYKSIPDKIKYNFSKQKKYHEEKKYDRECETEIFKEYMQEADYTNKAFREGGDILIKKAKLSGAKIAQIEGLKPEELTNKMNIVISEFLRKSGKEERFDENEFSDSQSRFRYENQSNSEDFSNGSSFTRESKNDKKLFEEFYETESKSFEIREMKSEKRYSETKHSKLDSKEIDSMVYADEESSKIRDDGNLTYIAIVEAHVYTNKDAIFEEQMRQTCESKSHSKTTQAGIIYYKCEVSVTYKHYREPLQQPTIVIESIEEIPSEEVFEQENIGILQKSDTGMESIAKKLAVQKITEVIEPLLSIKEVKSVNIKQAYPVIEMPLKLIAESTDVAMERESNILEPSKLLLGVSQVSIEPLKAVVETTELSFEEAKSGVVDIYEAVKLNLEPILETTVKPIAETSEILIEESSFDVVNISEPLPRKPNVSVESAIRSAAEINEVIVDDTNIKAIDTSSTIIVTPRCTLTDNLRLLAETITTIPEEPKSEYSDVLEIKEEAVKVGYEEIIATEISEVIPEEPVYTEITRTETKRKQSEIFLEIPSLVLPEITTSSVEEPICEELFVSKVLSDVSKTDININFAVEITEISHSEKEQSTFEIPIVIKQQGDIAFEESKATETISIPVEEPIQKSFEILPIVEKQTHSLVEKKILTAAETIFVIPEETEITFGIENKNLYQQAYIGVVDSKTAITSFICPEEPIEEKFELSQLQEKKVQVSLHEASLVTAITTEVLLEGPLSENLTVTKSIQETAALGVEKLHFAVTTVVEVEEPANTSLDITAVKENQIRSVIQEGYLPVVETLEIVPEEAGLQIHTVQKIKDEKARVNIELLETAKTTEITVREPIEGKLEQVQLIGKKPKMYLHDSSLTTAVTLEVHSDEPHNQEIKITKPITDTVNIDIEERQSAVTTSVYPEEPKQENILSIPLKEKQIKSIIEKRYLPVVQTTVIVPEEAGVQLHTVKKSVDEKAKVNINMSETAQTTEITIGESIEGNIERIQLEEKVPQVSLYDTSLTAAVTLETLPEGPCSQDLKITKPAKDTASISIGDQKHATTELVYVEEPKHENLEITSLKEKQIQESIENPVLCLAETSSVCPESPKNVSFDTTLVINDRANVVFDEIKPVTVSVVTSLDSQEEKINILQIDKKQAQALIEDSYLPLVETITIVPEESNVETYTAKKIIDEKAKTNVEVFLTTQKTEIFVSEPKEENLKIATIKAKQNQIVVEPVHFSAAETSLVIPEEPKQTFDTTETSSQLAHLNVIEQKAIETLFVFPLELRYEDIVVNKAKEIIPQTLFENVPLTVAENIIVFTLQKEKELSIAETLCQKPVIDLQGLKVGEIIIVLPEEPRREIVEVPQIIKKTPQVAMVDSFFSVAETLTILQLETQVEIFNLNKLVEQHANLIFDELKAIQVTIVAIVEPENAEFTATVISSKQLDSFLEISIKTLAKVTVVYIYEAETIFSVPSEIVSGKAKTTFEAFIPFTQITMLVYEEATDYVGTRPILDKKQCNVTIVESMTLAVANSITVTVKVAEKQIEKFDIVTVTELSSSSSTISSAPSTPLIEEYVFGVHRGHEYRVQSPQEASLEIKTALKNTPYNVENIDSYYTLTIEALDENEQVQIVEEEDVSEMDLRKKQFWISDIKTIESLESLDSKVQLMKVKTDIERMAIKELEYFSDQDITIKTRSQSFDQSADFELNLQSLELDSKTSKTKTLDTQATFDIKTAKAFKSLENEQSIDANVNLKTKAEKSSTVQSIDVAYGLTLEREILADDQSMDIDIQSSQQARAIKSIKRQVNKGESKQLSSETSASEIAIKYSNFDGEMEANQQSSSISLVKYATTEGNLALSSIAKESDSSMAEAIEAHSVTKSNYLDLEGSKASSSIQLQSNLISKGSVTAMGESIKASKLSKSYIVSDENRQTSMTSEAKSSLELQASFESNKSQTSATIEETLKADGISKANYLGLEGSSQKISSSELETSNSKSNSISKGIHSKKAQSLDSKVSVANLLELEGSIQSSVISKASSMSRMQANLETSSLEMSSRSIKRGSRQKLSLQTDLSDFKAYAGINGEESPPSVPTTPLTDEYIFRLQRPYPEETIFIPRDCSFSPRCRSEESVIIVNGLIPHIRSKIRRILYSPPLQTPPTSPERKVFTKPGLKGGSRNREFTEEEIRDIEKKSALLASEIDKTIRSIEEYKESVGIGTKKEVNGKMTVNNLVDKDKESKINRTDKTDILSVNNDKECLLDICESRIGDEADKLETSIQEDKECLNGLFTTKNNSNDNTSVKKTRVQLLSKFSHI